MDLAEVYSALGQEPCAKLVRSISVGALRTYGAYQEIKIRSRLRRFNRKRLRAAAPRLWQRVVNGDEGLARDLSRAVFVSNIPVMVEVLDLLGIEHDGSGFISKVGEHAERLKPGWEQRAYDHVSGRFPEELVLLYINHLGWETKTLDQPFLGPAGDNSDTQAET